MKKTLVLYLYKEDRKTKRNLDYFLKNGVVEDNLIDFGLIINDHICSLDLGRYPFLIVMKKENSYDLNSYRFFLEKINFEQYQYFIFLNSSCKGPFLPVYYKGLWTKYITQALDDKVKLVGPVAEIPPDNLGVTCLEDYKFITAYDKCVPFIHTYCFATDTQGLKILLDTDTLTNKPLKQDELIQRYERAISSVILNEGFKIESLLLKYKNIDINDKKFWIANKKTTCPEVPKNYDGIDLNPLELIFVKNIRRPHQFRRFADSGISKSLERQLEKYSQWLSLGDI